MVDDWNWPFFMSQLEPPKKSVVFIIHGYHDVLRLPVWPGVERGAAGISGSAVGGASVPRSVTNHWFYCGDQWGGGVRGLDHSDPGTSHRHIPKGQYIALNDTVSQLKKKHTHMLKNPTIDGDQWFTRVMLTLLSGFRAAGGSDIPSPCVCRQQCWSGKTFFPHRSHYSPDWPRSVLLTQPRSFVLLIQSVFNVVFDGQKLFNTSYSPQN